MSSSPKLVVKSNVARDLLHSAALFKTDKQVVWEYVSNGLQYSAIGTNPVIKVLLDSKKKKIAIQDNGRGMDGAGLQNFFVMHGQNIDRKEGKPGRGMFGTGKSAAFGIAEVLRIITVRNGKRSRVELKRSSLDAMSSADPDARVPVEIIEYETPVSDPNGTLIEIEGIHLRSLDETGIMHFIERHLAHWPKNATVFVNNRECEYCEPPVGAEYTFIPEGEMLEKLGDVELVLKVSKVYLEDELRGVSVYSKEVWHETTLAGSEGREMSQYIFGEIDVPALDEENEKSAIKPFDVSRSMRLNPENELVRSIHAFIGSKIEEVRRGLVDADKKRKSEEESKKLAEQASEIARIINEDFDAFRRRLAQIRAKTRGGPNFAEDNTSGDEPESDLIFGTDIPAVETASTGSPGISEPSPESGGASTSEVPPFNPTVEPNPIAEAKGKLAGGSKAQRRPSGGFRVDFKAMGEASARACYIEQEQTISINLDHPQIAAAKGNLSVEDLSFKRLAYEVAFSEYAIAIAQLGIKSGHYLELSEPIVDIRERLNLITRKASSLYAQ